MLYDGLNISLWGVYKFTSNIHKKKLCNNLNKRILTQIVSKIQKGYNKTRMWFNLYGSI